MTISVSVSAPGVSRAITFETTDECARQVSIGHNPSASQDVDVIKMLSAALIRAIDELPGTGPALRSKALAKTNAKHTQHLSLIHI